MVKHIFLSAALVVGGSVINAQTAKKIATKPNKAQKVSNLAVKDENHHVAGAHHCGTDEAMAKLFASDPEAKARYEASLKEDQKAAELSNAKIIGTNSVFANAPHPIDTIPVVVHILHQGGSENISNQVVYDAIAGLNRDYQKLDPDTVDIDAYFQARATACNLRFVLATKDPNGNCTNGIIRHYDANTDWDQATAVPAYTGTGAGKWNPSKYMNIYFVKNIIDDGGSAGIIVGYTYLPGTWGTGNARDAIIYNSSFLDVPSKEYRSLSHEVGHWLKLPHTFGNSNSAGGTCDALNDDGLATISGTPDDTPPTSGFFSTCPASTPNVCYPTYSTENYANVENIMDYSSCPKMFTLCQCKRMRLTLTQTTSGRNNLVTAANKIATGVRVPQICSPAADFGADKKFACTGSNITFADSTSNAVVTGWNWDFPGGTPSTSTLANPVVTYATPGVYAVTYTATNSTGSNSITKAGYVTISSSTATYQTSMMESFESIIVPNSNWSIDNSNGGPGWAQTSTAAATGSSSMMISNFTNTGGSVETFYTPSYNMAAINTPAGSSFTFKLSHKRKTSTAADKLQVFSSVNCGQTWTQRYSKNGSGLANAGVSATAFTPTSSADWRTETVPIGALSAQTNVMFKFVLTADATGACNNIFIDDINIVNNSMVGVYESIENQLNYTVFPNPNNGNMHISFELADKNNVKLELVDLLG
ncbi:MAG TPA: M43 family zinc metalloprotease, partial [Bacteroidia bacterium]